MPDKKKFYSKSQKKIQTQKKGSRVAEALLQYRVHYFLKDEYKKLIKKSNFLIISTISDKYPDTSIKSGLKGFVKILDNRNIEWEDYDGNRMFRTIGNILKNKFVSILFLDLNDPENKDKPNTPVKLRLLGQAKYISSKKKIKVKIDFAFSNCPRYLPNYKFVSDSKFLKRLIIPEWKKRSYIKKVL